jgi:hypothetical protein
VAYHTARVTGRADVLQLSKRIRDAYESLRSQIETTTRIKDAVGCLLSLAAEEVGEHPAGYLEAACLVELCEAFYETKIFGSSKIAPQLAGEQQ